MELSEAALLGAAGERVFDRGLDYVQWVHGLRFEADEARASIQARNVYTVRLSWRGRRLDGECSCPHNLDGNFCKHLVAVGLAVLDGRAAALSTEQADALDRYLDGLEPDALRSLIIELMAIDGVAEAVQLRAVAAGTPGMLDADDVLARVKAEMPRGPVDYRASFDVGRRLEEMLDWLEDVLDANAADVARPALVYMTERIRSLQMRSDDSAGVIGDAGQRAVELHARSCLDGAPDARKLGRWLAKFRAESPGWPSVTLDLYLQALGTTGLAGYRSTMAKLADSDSSSEYEIRTMCIELADHDGDVDEAVRLLSADERHMSYREIIDRLRAAGRHDDAMTWLDRAVADGRLGRISSRQHAWISPGEAAEAYLAADRSDEALAVLRWAFSREIGPDSLRLLLEVAGRVGRADAERSWALAFAEERAGKLHDGSALVLIALSENDVVSAWSAAERFGAGAAWQRLAEASAADLPVAAADLYRPELDQLLSFADTQRYPAIAKILRTMRDLYGRVGEGEVIDALIADIREKYRRRTSLLAALDRARL